MPSTKGSRSTADERVHLMVLGPARFSVGDSAVHQPLSARRALLVGLLADAGPAGVPRERLSGLMWHTASASRALNATKQLVYKLRQQVGVHGMIQAGSVLRLNAELVTTDLWDVLDAARRRDHEQVLERHGGRFLDGTEAWDPPDLEGWLGAQRARALRLLHEATERIASGCEGAGDAQGASRAWTLLSERLPADAWVRKRLEATRATLHESKPGAAHAGDATVAVKQDNAIITDT